jgi:hypothetical protein
MHTRTHKHARMHTPIDHGRTYLKGWSLARGFVHVRRARVFVRWALSVPSQSKTPGPPLLLFFAIALLLVGVFFVRPVDALMFLKFLTR